MSDIPDQTTFCDPAEDAEKVGEILFCDTAEDAKKVGELRFCDKDEQGQTDLPGECQGLDELEIAGSETPGVGTIYGASGGLRPYSWSISAGVIDGGGRVNSLSGACGAGSVTVTDACGNTATMDVRFPDGQWVLKESWTNPCYWWADEKYLHTEEVISGHSKHHINFSHKGVGMDCAACECIAGWCCDSSTTFFDYFGIPGDGTEVSIYPSLASIYAWECP
ncbi:MAG: hypothetical protein AB7D06_08945 [Pedobacter sp.]